MFQASYNVLGSAVVCLNRQTTASFSKESKIYAYIKRHAQACGWSYIRVDTTNQMGFPDILLLKRDTYWQIEAKLLKKKTLVSIEDDLDWQFGQIGYMKKSISRNTNYLLAIGKNNTIAFIKGEDNGDKQCISYPDFIRQI